VPISFERDAARRRIVATSVGAVTLSDTLAIVDRQAAEGAWSYAVLYDTRGSESLPSLDDVNRLVRHVGKMTTRYGPRGPVAMLVSDAALRVMAARYANLGELTAMRVSVFTTIEDAERWLDDAMA
jgi:hypothetical protein